jgi:16S rRNA processing protein RimM
MTEVVLGEFVKAIGLRGEIKLRELPDFWEAALGSARLFVVRGTERRPVHVRRSRQYAAGMTALALDGIERREAAEACVGAELTIEMEGLDVAPPDTPRPYQVRGIEVRLPDGSTLGRVVDRLDLPAHAVYVVQNGDREYLIPDAAPVVLELDLAARVMRIDPVPGLLEL